MPKNKKIVSLLSLVFLLTGCGDKTSTPSDTSIDTEPISTRETETDHPTDSTSQNVLSGDFEKENEDYVSSKAGSMMLLDDKLSDGTYQSTILVTNKLADNGLIFSYSETEKSYYFIGKNLTGKLVLQRIVNDKITTLKSSSLKSQDSEFNLSIFIDSKENVIDCYYQDSFLFQVEDELLPGDRIGFKAGSKDTRYSSISIKEGKNTFSDSIFNYEYPHGEFDFDLPGIVSSSRSSMAVSDDRTFQHGVYEADIKINPSIVSQNGLVFSLSSDKDKYWEGKGISYYFFYITETGRVCLGRTDNGSWNTIFEKVIRPFDKNRTYHIKVVKGDTIISCYVDDILYGTYVDNNPLTGNKIGVRTGDAGIIVNNIRIHEIGDTKKQDDSYLVTSGSFYSISNQIVSNSPSSTMVMKDSKMKTGTITTNLSSKTGDTGIIFRVTRNGNDLSSYYWFGYQTNQMVAFKRVENGKVIKSKDKFLPWGSIPSQGYQVKIVMTEKDMYCYFDGRLAVVYHDDTPLTGEEYGVMADGRNAQIDRFQVDSEEKIEHYETLIFGHSYMDYWYTYQEDLDEYEDLYDIGIGASVTSHWNDYTNEVIAYQPKLGIYGIGINDISSNISSTTIVANVKKMLTDIKAKLPEFEAVVWGVSRCPARTSFNAQISEVNQGYENLAKELSWVHYVDVELLFCNTSGYPLAKYFTDGLHPTHEGYLMMVEQLRSTLA